MEKQVDQSLELASCVYIIKTGHNPPADTPPYFVLTIDRLLVSHQLKIKTACVLIENIRGGARD